MANQLPPGQQQIYDHFETESSYSLDDLAEAFLQYSKRDIGRFLARLRGRGFLRYEELSGLYTCVPEHEREDEEQPVEVSSFWWLAAYVPPPIKAVPQLTWPLLGACAWSLHHVRAAPLVGSIVSCLTFAMALAATAIVERERRTSNRSFVEFHVGDRVHVLEPAKFAGNVGTVVKRDATEGSVVVRLEGSNVSLEALHSQLQGFGEFRAGDRVRTLGAGTYGFAAFYAGLVHVFCWYAQIHPGHGIYEGRKPALLDSALQSFLDAPLFVWYEVAFACGYDPALKQELDAAVEKQHAAWDL